MSGGWRGNGRPPAFLDLDGSLIAVKQAIESHQLELGLQIPLLTDVQTLKQRIICHFVRYPDSEDAIPISCCKRAADGAEIFFYFTEKEEKHCPPRLASRFEHELAHAIRYLYVLDQIAAQAPQATKRQLAKMVSTIYKNENIPSHIKREGPKSGILYQGLYGLTEDWFQPGDLIEHILHEGVVVRLHSTKLRLFDDATLIDAQYVKVRRLSTVTGEEGDIEARLWDRSSQTFGPLIHYQFGDDPDLDV